jgi:hypothetical protein
MAETVRWCEAHGSDWYRDWCTAIEMARREGHRVVDLDPCRPVEGVWSLPGELIDPANVDYDAAMRVMRSWLVEDNDAPLLSAVRWAVDAALGVGEPAEGNEE